MLRRQETAHFGHREAVPHLRNGDARAERQRGDRRQLDRWSGEHQRAQRRDLVGCGRAGGRERMGETLYVPMPDGVIEVEVSGTVFFDEKGERLNG